MKRKLTNMAVGVIIAVMSTVPAWAWTPDKLFRGKTGFVLSVVAATVANAEDYRWTVNDVYSGAGHEANPLLLNNSGTLSRDRLVGIKLGSGGLVIGELFLMHKHPSLRPVFTTANWGFAGVLGVTAYHNRQVFGQ